MGEAREWTVCDYEMSKDLPHDCCTGPTVKPVTAHVVQKFARFLGRIGQAVPGGGGFEFAFRCAMKILMRLLISLLSPVTARWPCISTVHPVRREGRGCFWVRGLWGSSSRLVWAIDGQGRLISWNGATRPNSLRSQLRLRFRRLRHRDPRRFPELRCDCVVTPSGRTRISPPARV